MIYWGAWLYFRGFSPHARWNYSIFAPAHNINTVMQTNLHRNGWDVMKNEVSQLLNASPLCVWVCPFLPDPSVCVTMGTACFLYPPHPSHTHTPCTNTDSHTPPPSLFPLLFTRWFQCYHGETCLSPLSLLPVSHLTGSLSASACCLCALGSALFAFSFFVCLLVLCICMTFCLAVFPPPVPVGVCFSLPAHWMFVWPPGFSTSNPSSPLSALLLCSDTLPPPPSASFLSAFPFFFLFSPSYSFVCSHIKTSSSECHQEHTTLEKKK